MFNKNSFKVARSEHSQEVRYILKHLNNCSHLCIKSIDIDLSKKNNVVEKVKSLGLRGSKGVYGFFVDERSIDKLQEKLEKYRKNRPTDMKLRQAVPFPNFDNDTKKGCLYIGMIREKNLENRILEHLVGTRSPRTGALKIHLWAKGLKQLKLSFIVFSDVNEYRLICEYEKALWKYYQPAVGKL